MGTGLTAHCYTVGKLKVTDTLMALFFAGINALIFSGTHLVKVVLVMSKVKVNSII